MSTALADDAGDVLGRGGSGEIAEQAALVDRGHRELEELTRGEVGIIDLELVGVRVEIVLECGVSREGVAGEEGLRDLGHALGDAQHHALRLDHDVRGEVGRDVDAKAGEGLARRSHRY